MESVKALRDHTGEGHPAGEYFLFRSRCEAFSHSDWDHCGIVIVLGRSHSNEACRSDNSVTNLAQ